MKKSFAGVRAKKDHINPNPRLLINIFRKQRMTAETIKLQLTLPALERLFAETPEIELQLRKQACREIASRHFKELADAELWRLSHGMTESIAEEVKKCVDGFASGTKEPTGRWRWYLSYPTSETVDNMIANACKKYLTDRVEAMAKQAVDSVVTGNESFEDFTLRTVKRIVRSHIQDAVAATVKESIDALIQEAIAKRTVRLKVVEDTRPRLPVMRTGKCEKCGAATKTMVRVLDRWAYWCGCDALFEQHQP
tara:strand:- start:1697 stop:2455 length:759 start_codon:yes stop_codon:yes gene_type:complete